MQEPSPSRTIREFSHQFGWNPQATSIRCRTIWKPRNAEIDYIRAETSPFRLERQETSMGHRHSKQGSIVRTSVLKPQFGHPFFIWATLILNPINTTENQPILPIKREAKQLTSANLKDHPSRVSTLNHYLGGLVGNFHIIQRLIKAAHSILLLYFYCIRK